MLFKFFPIPVHGVLLGLTQKAAGTQFQGRRCLFQPHDSVRRSIGTPKFKFGVANLVYLGAALRAFSQPGPGATELVVIYPVGSLVVS